jgi:hypothetical protein
MGRGFDQLLQVRCDAAFLARLDDWRRLQPDIPSRGEAVRRLVDQGIGAAPAPQARP